MTHWRAAQSECVKGHPFPENLRIDKRGWAVCRTCQRATYVPVGGVREDEVDEIAVELAVTGTPPSWLSPGERTEVVHRLTDRGWTSRRIAEHIGCSRRTVFRARAGKKG